MWHAKCYALVSCMCRQGWTKKLRATLLVWKRLRFVDTVLPAQAHSQSTKRSLALRRHFSLLLRNLNFYYLELSSIWNGTYTTLFSPTEHGSGFEIIYLRFRSTSLTKAINFLHRCTNCFPVIATRFDVIAARACSALNSQHTCVSHHYGTANPAYKVHEYKWGIGF